MTPNDLMSTADTDVKRLRQITRFLEPLRRYRLPDRSCGATVGGRDPRSGALRFLHTRYPRVFNAFRDQLVDDGWLEGEYSQDEGFRYMHNMCLIDDADVETLGRLLLFCDRGEYWSIGFWKQAVESGFVTQILVGANEGGPDEPRRRCRKVRPICRPQDLS
jgi:hypothetical protein